MINPKGSTLCDGCTLYGDKCHCLCHKDDIINGKHEIVYSGGPAPKIIELEGERD